MCVSCPPLLHKTIWWELKKREMKLKELLLAASNAATMASGICEVIASQKYSFLNEEGNRIEGYSIIFTTDGETFKLSYPSDLQAGSYKFFVSLTEWNGQKRARLVKAQQEKEE